MVSINNKELNIKDVIAVSRFLAPVEAFKGVKREKVDKIRKYIEENWFSDDAPPRYGFNTGIGSLKNVKISHGDIGKFQRNYIRSHSVGVGEPLDVEIVRGAMLLQANGLAKGFSGVRSLIIDKLIEMLNKKIHPVVPGKGSLGASGDLAPLTHIASVLVGEDEAEIWIDDEPVSLKALKDEKGVVSFGLDGESVTFQTINLEGKEAISLTNATSVMLSIAIHLVHDVEMLLINADISGALSLEAMMCENDAFYEPLHILRNQKGQLDTADNIRALIKDSQRMTNKARIAYFDSITKRDLESKLTAGEESEKVTQIYEYKFKYEFDDKRIQDSYSLRCIPQVHGACKDAFNYVKKIVVSEISAVTDNPVIFEIDGEYVSKSGGNFHGEPLAFVMDFLAIAVSELGSIAERRMYRLLTPRMSFGLPPNLAGGKPGLNSGYMMVQYTAAQLVSENKVLCHPASIDSIPTSDNQEDHVSMGLTAASKAHSIVKNVQYLIAMEFLLSIQGIHLSSRDSAINLDKFPLGAGTDKAFRFLSDYEVDNRRPFKLMVEDEYLHTKIKAIEKLSSSGAIIDEIKKEIDLKL